VTIPLPQISLPRFRFGDNQKQGVGQGEGETGQPAPGQQGDGPGRPARTKGKHSIEVDVSLEDLAKILGEELELPNIEPRGHKQLRAAAGRYTGISRAGPMSLRHFKRTFREALKRQIASGTYDPDHPLVIPIREDLRFRALQTREGAAGQRRDHLHDGRVRLDGARAEGDRAHRGLLDRHLAAQPIQEPRGVYIVHDAVAQEVDQHTFFHLRESGGTKISSAYELCLLMMRDKYPPRSGTSTRSTSPTATTGRRATPNVASRCCGRAAAARATSSATGR
jgi:hypothetical protein